MNLFTKLKIMSFMTFIVVLLSSILFFIQNDYASVLIIITLILSLFSFMFMTISFKNYNKELEKLNITLKKVANGNLYYRVTKIDKNSLLANVSWNVNNLLDQVESFNRDTSYSLKGIASGNMNRRMYPKGLHGDFVTVSKEINNALEIIAIAQSKDEFIQNMLLTLKTYINGDYRPLIDTSGMQEDIIQLANGINDLGSSLSEISSVNYRNGKILEHGSEVLSTNVSSITNSANSQAASLEETAAALEEITESMKQSNINTIQMSTYAKELTKSAKDGELLANKTTKSMEEINKETSAIKEAITVIDQIAFQTNILSLNAAVEAATAGEAGKGFAVVAQEVRNLAGRSAEAAKEIKELVESANVKADYGKNIANEMISGYTTLNENINLTIGLLDDVMTSSKEQEQGIIQINDAITVLDRNTQENAEIARQTNIIAEQTQDIALKIVNDANKEFHGKDKIKIRTNIVDPNYKGKEQRKLESKMMLQ